MRNISLKVPATVENAFIHATSAGYKKGPQLKYYALEKEDIFTNTETVSCGYLIFLFSAAKYDKRANLAEGLALFIFHLPLKESWAYFELYKTIALPPRSRRIGT